MDALSLESVTKAVHGLPSLPAVVLDLLASLGQADVDIEALARKLSQDQALTAKTLRLANSPFYGLQRQVISIQDAIAVLGFTGVRNLAVTGAVVNGLPRDQSNMHEFLGFWRHTLGTALCAQALAAQRRIAPGPAYVAGLLHDIGRLALLTWFPEQYADVTEARRAADNFVVEAEQAVLGMSHATVGAALARHWRIPDTVAEAIELHHTEQLETAPELVLLIGVADALTHALGLSQSEDELVPHVAQAAWDRLGLNAERLAGVLRDVERQFEASSGILFE